MKWLKRIAVLLFLLILVAVLIGWWLMRGSVPQLDGEITLGGLSAPVTIQRDPLGVVTIDAANETDAMRALGYVHAQERFFEMDLMRRTAAGELAELFGPIAIDTDKRHRIHRMRARVMENLEGIVGDKLPQVQAYVDGVNAGLADLSVRPWPYLLIQQQPAPWRLEDSALTGYAMYFDLQDSTNTRELALWKIKQRVPPALFDLLTRDGTSWDAPLMGTARGDAMLPGGGQLDLRKLPMPAEGKAPTLADKGTPGSNSFAISGELTKDGRAIVANDMHLGLRAPNIWFRARLRYADAQAPGGRVEVQGFTLPGLPAVVVGSNGHIAWGFTNSYIDSADWFNDCESAPGLNPVCKETGVNARTQSVVESIKVKGQSAIAFKFDENDFGPAMATDLDGHPLRLWWNAHAHTSLDFKLTELAAASDLDAALLVAESAGMPTQNLLVVDRTGRPAWTLIGPVYPRSGEPDCNPFVPAWALPSVLQDFIREDGSIGGATARRDHLLTTGYASDPGHSLVCGVREFDRPAAKPTIIDPGGQRLWTANNRLLDGEPLKQVGDGGYAFGARAKQIRDDLFAKKQFAERDLLAIQLDDRALMLTRWWQLLRAESGRAKSPALTDLSAAAKTWQGRASTDSVSYRIVRAWRLAVHARIADGLTAPAQASLGDDFVMPDLPQLEGVAWPLVTQRPAHLLPRRFANWDALFEDAAKEVRDDLATHGPLSERTWGERNTAAICHPLAGAIPLLGRRLLCMPRDQLAGDGSMPRVQGPAFGASERMVVSPGHEQDGIIHMPGGQSGHPLSPFWGAGHDDWVHGRPTPFLPGKPGHTLHLQPEEK